MKEPAVHYFDGQSSVAHTAHVTIHELDVISIRYGNSEVSWLLTEGHVDWERTHDGIRIRYGEYPKETLQVKNDKELTKELVNVLNASGKKDLHDSLLQGVRKAPVIFAIALLAICVLGYLFVLPKMAEGVASTMPLSADVKLGEMVYANLESSGALDINHERSVTLQDFANALTLASDHELKLHFVNSSEINAFALPGGHIVVFSGIIEEMDEPEQLAALLAHEAAHVQERHSTRQMMRDIAGYAFVSLIMGDVNGVMAVVAQHANDFRSLSHSRDLEREADQKGIEDLVSNGIDPHGMVHLLELLDEAGGDFPEELQFLSTHPLTSDRISEAREFAAQQEGLWSVTAEMRADFNSLQQGQSGF